MPFLRPTASLLVGVCLLAPTTNAQLKLPKHKVKDSSGTNLPPLDATGKDKPVSNGVVPHLVCSRCEAHNYSSAMNRPQPDGTYTAWCTKCAKDTPHKRSAVVEVEARLQLPGDQPTARPKPANPAGAPKRINDEVRYGDTAAGFIVREVRATGSINGEHLEKAVESLIGLGEEGRVTARIVLHDTNPAVSLMAGRVLVRGGVDEDAERVVARLATQMPAKSGSFLLEELVERDPVHGSPKLLVAMLEHKQKTMRTKAEHLLADRLSPEVLPQLRETMKSKRSDSRLAAIRLVQRVDDPAVLEILLEHLDDSSSRVADVVIKALASRTDDSLDLTLLAHALQGNWILRQHAYAILAIIEREDELLRPIFDDRHSELLLKGLRSRDTLVHGTCAAALAGIGFRSAQPDLTEWLDREVTGTMVASISGREFFNDFAVMQPRVLRRLRLLTGENFGTDGPEWTRWWVAHRSDFYAHRAFLSVPRDGESTLELHFRGTGTEGGAFTLYGSDAWSKQPAKKDAQIGEQLILNHRECTDLIALLEREGVLGPDLAPGVRGNKGFGQRALDVVIDGQGKSFVFGSGRSAPWFERVTGAMGDMRARNRWQRYRPAKDFPDVLSFWDAESGWWAGEHDAQARGLRMKDLVFRSVRDMPPSYRRVALRELEGLYATPGVAAASDFEVLLDLLRDEGFFTERSDQLVNLGIQSAKAQPDGTQGELNRALGMQLLELLMARFSTNAIGAMGRIATACGRGFVEELASNPQPMLRAVAAAELATKPNQDERMLLIEMLDDIEPLVQASAASALGIAKVEEARTELLLRARIAPPMVRAAALRAVGQLGGEYVLEALVLGVADNDLEVKRGAAEGLAILANPQSTPLLISLLRQGRGSEIFNTARDGLIALGEGARTDLRRVVSSPVHSARKDCALLLARMGDPWVAGAMISLLESQPDDREMAFELAVLTCVDFSGVTDAAISWREWYEDVTHEDSTAWLIAALERMGIALPPGANFKAGPGARDGGLILLTLLRSEEAYLAERARRDLGTLLGGEIGEIPSNAIERAAWLLALRETILKRFES